MSHGRERFGFYTKRDGQVEGSHILGFNVVQKHLAQGLTYKQRLNKLKSLTSSAEVLSASASLGSSLDLGWAQGIPHSLASSDRTPPTRGQPPRAQPSPDTLPLPAPCVFAWHFLTAPTVLLVFTAPLLIGFSVLRII